MRGNSVPPSPRHAPFQQEIKVTRDIDSKAWEELEGLVNEPLRVSTVEASILMYEEESGATKISFRSKPPREPDGFFFDVSAASRLLGGGGHVHASGARFDGGLDGAQAAVIKALQSTIGDA